MLYKSQAKNDTVDSGAEDTAILSASALADWLLAGINVSNLILIVGGNALVIIAILRQTKLRNSATNNLIASLSLSDTFVGLVFMPSQVAGVFGSSLLVTEFLCDAVMTVSWTFMNSTVFSLLCIAIDRYRAIVTPMKPRVSVKQARWMILLTWLTSFLYSSNYIMLSGIVPKTTQVGGQNVTTLNCWYIVSSDIIGLIVITDFAFFYFLPLLVISVLYAKMISVLYFGNSPNDKSRRRKRQAIKMLIVVLVMFGISWLPFRIMRLLRIFAPRVFVGTSFSFVRAIAMSFAVANSWVNPFIFAIFGSNFRKEFVEILTCKFLKSRADASRAVNLEDRASRPDNAHSESKITDKPLLSVSVESSLQCSNDDGTIHTARRTIAIQTEQLTTLPAEHHTGGYDNTAYEASKDSPTH
ncbi:galanin receptor 2a-like [Ptychodera flava]|uniref:galanin receptor 2a-like n=1 Tax=Ptychodera flava TaxID=63121 RepID=UPI003969F049